LLSHLFFLSISCSESPSIPSLPPLFRDGFLLHEILYQTELLNGHLISTFKALPKAPIIADSAEPKSIAELQAAGLTVIPCEKGADSINFGIKHVQGLPISYTSSSTNLHDEYENYSWKVTKDRESQYGPR
jgi:phage terminase large subunit